MPCSLTTTSTAEELKEFKEVVVEKIAGLQTSIRKLDTKRQSDPDAAEREWIQAEQEQIEECISLYTSLFEHVEMAQRKLQGDNFSDQEVLLPKIKVFQNFRTKKITADQLEDIKSRLPDKPPDLKTSSTTWSLPAMILINRIWKRITVSYVNFAIRYRSGSTNLKMCVLEWTVAR